MKLQLWAIGDLDRRFLEELREGLGRHFRLAIEIAPSSLNPEFAFHPERQQYHSSELLARMQQHVQNGRFDPGGGSDSRSSSPVSGRSGLFRANGNNTGEPVWRVLGVTAADLYIPILTFVFGEAQVGGPCAVVSLHRLRQEFYGLPPDPELLQQRLLKEAVHELGHTMSLTHCEDYSCVMAASHAVEWIDMKEAGLCELCHSRAVT
jgi:archaemetzincin